MPKDVDMKRAYEFPHTMEIDDRFSDKAKRVILGKVPLESVHGRVFVRIKEIAQSCGDKVLEEAITPVIEERHKQTLANRTTKSKIRPLDEPAFIEVDMNSCGLAHSTIIGDLFSRKQKEAILGWIPLKDVDSRVFIYIKKNAQKCGDKMLEESVDRAIKTRRRQNYRMNLERMRLRSKSPLPTADIDMSKAYVFPHEVEFEGHYTDLQIQILSGEIVLDAVHGRIFSSILERARWNGDKTLEAAITQVIHTRNRDARSRNNLQQRLDGRNLTGVKSANGNGRLTHLEIAILECEVEPDMYDIAELKRIKRILAKAPDNPYNEVVDMLIEYKENPESIYVVKPGTEAWEKLKELTPVPIK